MTCWSFSSGPSEPQREPVNARHSAMARNAGQHCWRGGREVTELPAGEAGRRASGFR
jgi:hypothetical protein